MSIIHVDLNPTRFNLDFILYRIKVVSFRREDLFPGLYNPLAGETCKDDWTPITQLCQLSASKLSQRWPFYNLPVHLHTFRCRIARYFLMNVLFARQNLNVNCSCRFYTKGVALSVSRNNDFQESNCDFQRGTLSTGQKRIEQCRKYIRAGRFAFKDKQVSC